MHHIDTPTPSRDFIECFCAAGAHLEEMARLSGNLLRWFKSEPTPPFLEHLSFSIGNQVFFVRLVDTDHMLDAPGTIQGLLTISKGCNGHACLLPMEKVNGKWRAALVGWGLLDAQTKADIFPPDLITYKNIEMSNWELQDFAIQIVKQHLDELGYEIVSSNNNPDVLPSMWYLDGDEMKWLIVLSSRYPDEIGPCANYWKDCVKSLREKGFEGMIVNVGFKGEIETADGEFPIYRDKASLIAFKGLVNVEDKLEATFEKKNKAKIYELLPLTKSPMMPAPWSSSTAGKTIIWGDFFALFQTNAETTRDIARKMQGQKPRHELLHDFALTVFYRRDKNPHGPSSLPILIFSLERFDFNAMPPGMPRLGVGVEKYPTLSLYYPKGRSNLGTIERPLDEQRALELLLETMRKHMALSGVPQIIGTIADARGHALTGWPAPLKKEGFLSKIKKLFS